MLKDKRAKWRCFTFAGSAKKRLIPVNSREEKSAEGYVEIFFEEKSTEEYVKIFLRTTLTH